MDALAWSMTTKLSNTWSVCNIRLFAPQNIRKNHTHRHSLLFGAGIGRCRWKITKRKASMWTAKLEQWPSHGRAKYWKHIWGVVPQSFDLPWKGRALPFQGFYTQLFFNRTSIEDAITPMGAGRRGRRLQSEQRCDTLPETVQISEQTKEGNHACVGE